ncbi:MAG: hypothetical protein H6736_04170 [Alphaproteobacteria bacterium]|nr:hypothetical protein [Alphaproteobacteria bacterium]
MKRRTSTPLLRAMVGSAILGCAGSGETGIADVEASTPPAPEPVELAPTREMTVLVEVPEDYTLQKGTPMIYVRNAAGELLRQSSVILNPRPERVSRTRWTFDHRIEVPRVVDVELVIPYDDQETPYPSREDLYARQPVVVGETVTLRPTRYMPQVEATLALWEPEEVELEKGPERPIYANTKGSHHYQDPPPQQAARLDVEGPDEEVFRTLLIRLLFDGETKRELRATVTVPRLPAEVAVVAPKGGLPPTYRLMVEAGGRSATVDSMPGDVARMVLREP